MVRRMSGEREARSVENRGGADGHVEAIQDLSGRGCVAELSVAEHEAAWAD